jgi:hypothetical protein
MCATDTGSVETVLLPKKMKIDSHFEFEFHFKEEKKEIRSNVIGLQ